MDRQRSARRRAVRPADAGPSRVATPAGGPLRDAAPPGGERAVRDCAVYCAGGRHPGRPPMGAAVGLAVDLGGFVWVGVHEPTEEEFAEVAAAFSLPALAVEDAVRAHQRPKLEIHDGVVFVVLKPVRYVDSAEVIETAELAVFVGEHFVVTVRHGDSGVLSEVRATLDAAEPQSPSLAHGPAGVLYAVADAVVDAYEQVATSIDDDVEEIEAQVFGGDQQDHAERIYKLKREVMQFRRAVGPLDQPLQRLADGRVTGIPAELAPYFRDVHDHALRAGERIEGHDRLLTDVLSADLAQVGVRQTRTAVQQNEDMRKISAWAAIALVPTAIAGIYGMNFEHMPELDWEYGYFAVLAVIATVCIALQRLFHRNGWL